MELKSKLIFVMSALLWSVPLLYSADEVAATSTVQEVVSHADFEAQEQLLEQTIQDCRMRCAELDALITTLRVDQQKIQICVSSMLLH